jgi:MFS family permease
MTARIAPMIIFMLLGGVIGDRFKRNRIVGGSDVIGSLFAGTSAISFIVGFANIPLLALMGGLFGILNALWWPAMSGVLPEILPKEALQKGNAVVGLLSNFGFVFGALVGGTVVTLYGSGWALLIDAISFLIAGLLVWNINLPPMAAREKNSMLHDLKIGWFEFISRSWVVAIVICFTFMNLCFEATISVLGPLAFNSNGHGPRNWSFNLAAITAGMIAGGFVSFKIHFSRPLVLGMTAIALVPGWIYSMGFQLPLGVVLLGAFVAGVAVELFTVVWGTSMQTNIPEESYSRVISYDAFGSYALAPIGIAFAGPLASWIGISHTLILAASVALVAALIPLTLTSVRSLKYQMAE